MADFRTRFAAVVPDTPLIPYEIHSLSRCLHYHTLDSMSLHLSSMVLHTQQDQSDACRRDNRPIASKDKDVNNDVLLVGSAFVLLTSE